MLGTHKQYIGTLIALQTCHVLVITRSTFQAANEQYPGPAALNALKRVEKKAAEALREAVMRTATRKLIYKRYEKNNVQDSTSLKGIFLNGFMHNLSGEEILGRFVYAWAQYAKYLRGKRNERHLADQHREVMMNKYLKKRGDAMHHAQLQRDMQLKSWDDGSGDEFEVLKLPPIAPNGPNKGMGFTSYLKSWPTPRQSPHYRLRVYSVLKSTAQTGGAATMLPLIQDRDNSRMSQPTRPDDNEAGSDQGSDSSAEVDQRTSRVRTQTNHYEKAAKEAELEQPLLC